MTPAELFETLMAEEAAAYEQAMTDEVAAGEQEMERLRLEAFLDLPEDVVRRRAAAGELTCEQVRAWFDDRERRQRQGLFGLAVVASFLR